MLFPTLTFAVFFALFYPVSWALQSRPRAWKIFVLGASYVFYGSWDWRFVSLIVASTLVNGLLARRIADPERTVARRYLTVAVLFDVGLLGVFKYYGFFAEWANALVQRLGFSGPIPYYDIVLPIGISFFTFQALSYVIDVYRADAPPATLLDFAVLQAFFPHLVAGPIVRAGEFIPQVRRPSPLLPGDPTRAAVLIGSGLFKKMVVSTFLASSIVDPVFASPATHSSLEILTAVYAYAVQIYADFSGYTDIAIGVALLVGLRLPQNFDRPYGASSMREFWQRWHMTLSRWLRDYLYIPLGGSRSGPASTARNLVLTMTLGGLWHGAAATFVLWGLFHGLALSADRWIASKLGGRTVKGGALVGRIVTFHVVCAGWILFRAPDMAGAAELVRRLFSAGGSAPLVTAPVVLLIVGALLVQQRPQDSFSRLEAGFARLPGLAQGALVGAWLFACVALSPEGVAPFIYFQF